jgi:hypothetical protein
LVTEGTTAEFNFDQKCSDPTDPGIVIGEKQESVSSDGRSSYDFSPGELKMVNKKY